MQNLYMNLNIWRILKLFPSFCMKSKLILMDSFTDPLLKNLYALKSILIQTKINAYKYLHAFTYIYLIKTCAANLVSFKRLKCNFAFLFVKLSGYFHKKQANF